MITQELVTESGDVLTLIHFDSGTWSGGRESVACTPNATEMSAQGAGRATPIRRTDDPRAATCPLCKECLDYVKAMKPYGGVK